jgi:hypothetical protein
LDAVEGTNTSEEGMGMVGLDRTTAVNGEVGSVGIPDVGSVGIPEVGSEGIPEVGSVGIPEVGLEGIPEVGSEGIPEVVGLEGIPEVGSDGTEVVNALVKEEAAEGCSFVELEVEEDEWMLRMVRQRFPGLGQPQRGQGRGTRASRALHSAVAGHSSAMLWQ